MNIYDCCEHGNLERLQQLIIEDSRLVNVPEYCQNGFTALHIASINGHLEIVKELIKAGANVNFFGFGWTPLHEASEIGHLEIVRELLKNGADVNANNSFGITPLIRASQNGHLDIVRELLKYNVSIDAKCKKYGLTALHYAVIKNDLEIVKELIHYSDLQIKDKNGNTVLKLARTQEMRQFIQNYLDLPEIKEPEING